MFKPVNSKVNFPQIEEHIMHLWRERNIFKKSLQWRENAPQFTLYDGPPTANGNPGIHHVLSRIYKDAIPRYKTMKGYLVPRKAGWDTHGLPVELEIEKKLGLTNKAQIEEYGIAEFNTRCKESVFSYLEEWKRLTERIAFWIDLDHPYITFENSYIETCWWAAKKLWDQDLITQGYRVTPHCPRCGTSLSSHEVALGYDETDDPSVYVKFKITELPPGNVFRNTDFGNKPVHLLAWTTTPWTLPGNVALAVSPKADYSVMEGEEDYLIMASALVNTVGLEGYKERTKTKGSDLANKATYRDGAVAGVQGGARYQPLFNPHNYGVNRKQFHWHSVGKETWHVSIEDQAEDISLTYPVIAADFVSMEDGTGIVHVAPSFGQDDYSVGEDNALNFVGDYVDLQGVIQGDYPFAGKFVKDADPLILENLESRGLLYRSETVSHTYPFCWRCKTHLLYYAKPSWYILTTARKNELISGNSEVNWYPEYIKNGRFGDWLENNVDWAFSRERYWGTPLPIWRCADCCQLECIGSIEELKNKPGLEGLTEPLDLHRPYVDKITFDCPQCSGRMTRVSEVFDAWFDSGAMPVAQWHYPFENEEQFDKSFPADYICEAIDQTRGWFYTLHALSTLLFGRPCYKNVICLGHILDAQGEKMSKSKGNVVDPWEIINKQGVDALRWYMFTSSPPGNVKRFSAEPVNEVMKKFLSTLWNTYSFFVMYANIDQFDPAKAEAPQHVSELDRWILSELNQLILEVTEAMDSYDPTGAGRKIEEFVDRLSNWYVRRSRRRFWKSEGDEDKLSAYFTLYHCLVSLAKLMAPLTPFVAEEIYQNLVITAYREDPESVHLCDFPDADSSKIDNLLANDTRLAMKVCSLGRAARSKAAAYFHSQAGIKVRQPLEKVIIKTRTKGEGEGLERLASQVIEELNVKGLEFAEEGTELEGQPGYSIATEGDYIVAIDTNIPTELLEEGMAREIVHRLQTMRRKAGFDIADHIVTYYQTEQPLKQAIERFNSYIKQETLSHELLCQPPEEDTPSESFRINAQSITLGVKRVGDSSEPV
ncbi:isoleucine--tRNA ligase [Chloroflexota bacterium]